MWGLGSVGKRTPTSYMSQDSKVINQAINCLVKHMKSLHLDTFAFIMNTAKYMGKTVDFIGLKLAQYQGRLNLMMILHV